MIKKAIEDWLTSTKERNYQAPFCQVLRYQGHTILYSSSHGQLEQGKDIITKGPDGTYNAYQLKTGNIGLSEWRAIKGEVEELVELPIDYPGVPKTAGHKAFLVANGEVTDPVRIQINDRNEDNIRKNRGHSALAFIGLQQLLKQFIDAQGDFVPTDLHDLRSFLDIYLHDGCSMLPKAKLFAVLNRGVFAVSPKSKTDAAHAITSSVILTGYLLRPFEEQRNYYAQAEGWTILASCIARYGMIHSTSLGVWKKSHDLAVGEITRHLLLLRDDTLQRSDLLEGDIRFDGGPLLEARTTIVLGALACLELVSPSSQSREVLDLIKNNLSRVRMWGEAAFPYIFCLVRFLEDHGSQELARKLLELVLKGVVNSATNREAPLLPHPYYGAEEVLSSLIPDRTEVPSFEASRGSSYILASLVEMVARRGYRDLLKNLWPKVTHCRLEEFCPEVEADYFDWRVKKGTNDSRNPRHTQSWAALVRKSQEVAGLSGHLLQARELLPFFIMACPHRATVGAFRILDQKADEARP